MVPAWSRPFSARTDVTSRASMSRGEYIGGDSAPTLHCACRNRIGNVSSRNRESPKKTSVASASDEVLDFAVQARLTPDLQGPVRAYLDAVSLPGADGGLRVPHPVDVFTASGH